MASVRKIHYMVREFKRSKDGTPLYCGRVLRTRNVDRESLVDFLVGKNTTVTRQDIGAVLALLDKGFPCNKDCHFAGWTTGLTKQSTILTKKVHAIHDICLYHW